MKYLFSFFFILMTLFSWSVIAEAQDDTPPTVTITTDDADNLVNGEFEATITFSEDVNDFGAGDITVTGGTISNFTENDDDEYTIDITPSSSGTVTIQVGADVATDADGNGNEASSKVEVTADLDAPTVTTIGVPIGTQNSAFDVIFTFSENVTGFDKDDITVNGEATATAVTGSGKSWTVTITPNADEEGDVTLKVNANRQMPPATATPLRQRPLRFI